jgi:GT2 family glycosyltransferase
VTRGPKIVVLGMMTKMPVAGIVWLTIPYLVGLRNLGYDPYYVEAHARTPSMLMERADEDGSARAAAFVDAVMRRFDFPDRWAYHALHSDGKVYGMSEAQLRALYRSAALIVNLHGGTDPLPEHTQTDRLVLIETDPVQLEIELYHGETRAQEFLAAHCAAFTWGENYGNPDCGVPLPDRVAFRPTRMPVLLDEWGGRSGQARDVYTTVGNWEQSWRDLEFAGQVYHWSKHHEFLKVIDLPRLSGRRFELALASYDDDALALLTAREWAVRPAIEISADIDAYREYVVSSRGEFTVAKDQNVRLRSGWFSDRSATYLASGRPVITQETGFGNALPTGSGLFGFSTIDEALGAVEAIEQDYSKHAKAASEIAREFFDSQRVLRRLVTDLGLPAFPPGLSLAPVSRAPTTLPDETVHGVAATALPLPLRVVDEPELTVSVVTADGLVYTRLALESLLSDPALRSLELIVIDNASTDGTRGYLRELASLDPRIRLVENMCNVGFVAAVNQSLLLARGRAIVLLNNDAIAPPGAIDRLVAYLDDGTVGLVGPVSNRAASEAEIDREYETLGELVDAAARRAETKAGCLVDVPSLTMFCIAFRRDVYDEVGPVDERFGLGLFEDDDYCMRVRRAGYRVAYADDVLVHHFGEASFGRLVSGGGYARLLEANRVVFEEKWGIPWRQRERRHGEGYSETVRRVRDLVRETVPVGSSVLVVSRGDDELLELGGRRTGHFPQLPGGVYAGHYPADAADAISQLDSLQADFLVVPRTSHWWLDYYEGLRRHLEGRCVRSDSAASIFELRETA